MGLFDKLLRVGEGKKQRALGSLVPDINALEPELQRLSDAELAHKTIEFRERIDRAVGDEIKRVSEEDDDEQFDENWEEEFDSLEELREARD